MAVGKLVREVCSVQGEQERGQDCCLWGHCTADTQSSHTMASRWGSRGSRTWGAGPLPWAPAGPPKAQAVWCCKHESKNMILTVLPGFYKLDSDCPGDRWCRRPPRPLSSLGWGVRYSGSLRGWFCIFPSFGELSNKSGSLVSSVSGVFYVLHPPTPLSPSFKISQWRP